MPARSRLLNVHCPNPDCRTASQGVVRHGFAETLRNADYVGPPLIVTDGFGQYTWAIRRIFGNACVYGQVVKTRRNNRVVRVDRKLVVGSRDYLEETLWESEDSRTLNTSFVERHNLTIRQGCSYLHRRSTGHARCKDQLEAHLELLRCHYNFVRGHMGLKYGADLWTPAMQAGTEKKPLSFRQIYTMAFFCVVSLWLSRQGRPAQERRAAQLTNSG
jgi:hypothetical protein